MFVVIVGCEFHGRQEEVDDHQGRCGYRGLPKTISQKDFKDQVSSALHSHVKWHPVFFPHVFSTSFQRNIRVLPLFSNQGLVQRVPLNLIVNLSEKNYQIINRFLAFFVVFDVGIQIRDTRTVHFRRVPLQ